MPASLIKLDAMPDLVEQVYQALVTAISDGSLAPGARVTQEDLAEQLSVSRQPVLQAIRMLKKDGLVLDAPGRGVMIAPLDSEWIARVYEVRGALESLAARLAAGRRSCIPRSLIDAGREAARGTDLNAMIDADIAFHTAIYTASGNPMIAQSARLHWCHIRRAMGAVLRVSTLRRTLWDEHEAIADAIASGDVDLAERLTISHGQGASEHITRLLATVLPHPSPHPLPAPLPLSHRHGDSA